MFWRQEICSRSNRVKVREGFGRVSKGQGGSLAPLMNTWIGSRWCPIFKGNLVAGFRGFQLPKKKDTKGVQLVETEITPVFRGEFFYSHLVIDMI